MTLMKMTITIKTKKLVRKYWFNTLLKEHQVECLVERTKFGHLYYHDCNLEELILKIHNEKVIPSFVIFLYEVVIEENL